MSHLVFKFIKQFGAHICLRQVLISGFLCKKCRRHLTDQLYTHALATYLACYTHAPPKHFPMSVPQRQCQGDGYLSQAASILVICAKEAMIRLALAQKALLVTQLLAFLPCQTQFQLALYSIAT